MCFRNWNRRIGNVDGESLNYSAATWVNAPASRICM
jgi:hypothetical protein